MREIHTEMIIDASPERVWQVLTDFRAYHEWNPLLREASGELVVGKRLRVKIAVGKRTLTIKPEVVRVDANRELAWRGSLPIPGLFRGEHHFEITRNGATQVSFHHWERFDGILVGVLGGMLEQTKRAFEQMNVALERRATAAPITATR